MWWAVFSFLGILAGCVGSNTHDPMTIITPNNQELYSVATIQRLSNSTDPIHIYIEGDGHAFDAHGQPTDDPTPRSTFMRDMMLNDTSPNVAYIARPCQFVMDDKCKIADWTSGRFSQTMVDSVAMAIRTLAKTRPVILVGYSGGAMISGLAIQKHPDIKAIQWITVAGVLNHTDWTLYFDDTPLFNSLNLNTLPHISQVHYIAKGDKIVPNELSKKWIGKQKMVVIQNATHDNIPIMKLDFIN